ncbi:MAG: nucleoside hydrolase [Thermoanaerobaculia bacterium]|nr:nucleoside hydrolase [Thermoanaerobaculia bacterium]
MSSSVRWAAIAALSLLTVATGTAAGSGSTSVILDTDIGTDIDDTWALALVLASPELDLKLVVTASGDTRERARVAAKFLAAAGRDDVPIGIGVAGGDVPMPQAAWARDYPLESYPGEVHADGVGALVDAVHGLAGDAVLLVIGPASNVAAALERDPSIAGLARVVAMSGSVDRGYDGAAEAAAEYNVRVDAEAASALYGAGWDLLVAPLDTAGQVQLEGDLYRRLRSSESPTVRALLAGYRVWEPGFEWGSYDTENESSTLYDALAVALAYDEAICRVEALRLEVSSDGFTRRSERGAVVRAALGWPPGGRGAFERFLVERLLAGD